MPFPSGTYILQIGDGATRSELEQFYSLLQGYLSAEHKEDGSHSAITADSVTTTGDVTSGWDGTFDGNVTADADGSPVNIGNIVATGVSGFPTAPGVRMTQTPSGVGACDFAIAADFASLVAPGLVFYEPINVAATGAAGFLVLYRSSVLGSAPSAYSLIPQNSTVQMSVGENTNGRRMAEVNGAIVRASAMLSGALLSLTSRLVPAQLTASVNNYAINTAARIFLSNDGGSYDITGIAAGVEGQTLWLCNAGGAGTITLKNNNGSSSAANRILSANSADTVLRAGNGSALLLYDATVGFWYVVGA